MKLFELAATKPSKQAAKVYESYFGDTINVDVISPKQARAMLGKVRKLVNEHKGTPAFHKSEQNPTYLKLMMMENVLAAKVKEDMGGGATVGMGQPSGGTAAKTEQPQNQPNAAGTQAMQAAQMMQNKKQIQDQIKIKQKEIQDLQQQLNNPTMAESRLRRLYRNLTESEVQQAQVVLAAQDMVDNVQKMSEQVSSMQFKDLPALCDQIKNQVGVDQAMQFNTDATAALAGLLQNLQGAKQQLDQALGVVTGQAAPAVPGMDDADAGMGGELGAEAGAEEGGIDAELGAEPDLGGLDDEEDTDSPFPGGAGLGREKR
jgi:hypothetical protein